MQPLDGMAKNPDQIIPVRLLFFNSLGMALRGGQKL